MHTTQAISKGRRAGGGGTAIASRSWPTYCIAQGCSCENKAKVNSSITKYKANKHNIGVKWKQCTVCDFKAKTNDHLNKHNKRMHTSK